MEIKTLEEITSKIGSGATPRGGQSAYKSEGISLIRSQNVYDFSFSKNGLAFIDEEQAKKLNNVTLKEDDILLNITGDSIARTCLVPNNILPARVNQHVSIIRCKSEYDSRFVNYYLINMKSYLLQICGVGGTRNALTKEALQKLIIRIPNTQKQIAKVLSDLDSKIEINNKINQELEAMAKTLYDYWFVQFDFPVALATSSELDSEPLTVKKSKPYKSSGGKMVFNEELKREIPFGWEVKKINDVIEVKDGTHDSPKSIEKGYKLITSKHLKIEGLDFKSANAISKEDYININKRSQVDTGDILFSMIGSIGTVYKVEEKTIDFAIKNVALYKTSENQSLKNYIYMYLCGHDMQRYMGNVIAGSIQKFIGLGSLRKMPLMIDEKTISTFEIKTKPIFNQINNLKLENQKLSELRDWLLPMLMNGQITVGGAEKTVSSLRGEPVSSEVEIKQSYNENANNSLGLVAEEGEIYKIKKKK